MFGSFGEYIFEKPFFYECSQIGDDEVIFTSTGDYTSEGGIFGRHAMSFSKDIDVLEILSSVNEELQRRV